MEDFKKIFYDKKEGLTNINKLYEKIHEISIVYELDDDDEIDYDIGKPSQEAKEHKKELSNKRIGIDETNIIEGKRERKPKVFYD